MAAWIPLIAAALASGTAIYEGSESRKASREAAKQATTASEKQRQEEEAAQARLEKQRQDAALAQTQATDAAVMKQRMGELTSRVGGSVSPEFYASVLQAGFPTASQDDINKAVTSFFTSTG